MAYIALTDKKSIESRYDSVELFYRNQILLSEIRKNLSSVKDIQRLCSKIAMDRANGKDLTGLKNSFISISNIFEILSDNSGSTVLYYLKDNELSRQISNICAIIDSSIKRSLQLQLLTAI